MRRASTSLLEKGIQNAIPFSRPHPRSKPQTVAEELTWKLEHRTGARQQEPRISPNGTSIRSAEFFRPVRPRAAKNYDRPAHLWTIGFLRWFAILSKGTNSIVSACREHHASSPISGNLLSTCPGMFTQDSLDVRL